MTNKDQAKTNMATPHYKSQYRMISKSLKPLTKLDMSNLIEVT